MRVLPLPAVVERLAEQSGCTTEIAEQFIRAIVDIVSDNLVEAQETVVPGVGTFRSVDVAGELQVEFAPDNKLAATVNIPFAMFEPVELDDSVTDEMLKDELEAVCGGANEENEDLRLSQPIAEVGAKRSDAASVEKQTSDDLATGKHAAEGPDEGQRPAPLNEEEPHVEPISHCSTPLTPPPVVSEMSVRQPDKNNGSEKTTYERVIEKERVVEHNGHQMFYIVLASLVALLVGFLAGYFANNLLNISGVKNVNISADDVTVVQSASSQNTDRVDELNRPPVEIDSAASSGNTHLTPGGSEAETPVDMSSSVETMAPVTTKIVTDTVRPGHFLTTIAQRHYGAKCFWVYIYMENQSKLNNPDLIPPMTVVDIPPASKYGIDAKNRESVLAAELKASEVLKRYER